QGSSDERREAPEPTKVGRAAFSAPGANHSGGAAPGVCCSGVGPGGGVSAGLGWLGNYRSGSHRNSRPADGGPGPGEGRLPRAHTLVSRQGTCFQQEASEARTTNDFRQTGSVAWVE